MIGDVDKCHIEHKRWTLDFYKEVYLLFMYHAPINMTYHVPLNMRKSKFNVNMCKCYYARN